MVQIGYLALVTPTSEKFTVVPPVRKPNAEYRSREHLTEKEVERLIEAAKATVGGTGTPRWCSWLTATAYVWRNWGTFAWSRSTWKTRSCTSVEFKQGSPATQPLTGRELRALRRLQRKSKSPYVFVSERGAPFSKRGFQAMLERAGEAAGFEMKIHPHMLRHACGFKLANDGVDTRTIQAYLGHKSIEHTVRYTELAPTRFKSLFRD